MSTNALALLPTTDQYAQMKEIASSAIKSGLLPSSIKSPEAALIIALKGFELGLPPMASLGHIHVVNGKPGCSAEIMLAEIRSKHPNCVINIIQSDAKACIIEAARKKEDKLSRFEFTIDEARQAGLLSKDVWKNYPSDMLWARCVTRMKRRLFTEILSGISHTPEELEDIKDVTPQAQQAIAQPAEPISIKTVKNYAPQTAEEAAIWKPGQSKPSDPVEAPKEVTAEEKKRLAAVEEKQKLIIEIKEVVKLLVMTPQDVAKRSNEYFGRNTDKLSNEELKQFATNLWEELNAQNQNQEGAANE